MNNRNNDTNSVAIQRYNSEFEDFFDRQASTLDKLSGSRIFYFNYENTQKEIKVNAKNFKKGLRILKSFIINYIHYVDDLMLRKTFMNTMKDIEKDYDNDEEYKRLIKSSEYSKKYGIELQKKYFDYLIRCFDLYNQMLDSLQTSLMPNKKDIRKKVSFTTYDRMYLNLSKYRGAVSDFISDYEFESCLDVYKKLLGYHYSYRLYIDPIELEPIDWLINNLKEVIYSEEFLNLYTKKVDDKLTSDDKNNVIYVGEYIFRAINKIYELTNQSLSYMDVLPKINRKYNYDRTSI